jgi:hypothetical protein
MATAELERALKGYQREDLVRQAAGRTIAAVSLVFLIIRLRRIVIPSPSADWPHWSALVLIAVAGCAICRSLVLSARKGHALDPLRTGIAIDQVRREVRAVEMRVGFLRITKKVPTVFVDLADGNTVSVPRLADDEQLARIEELLRRQLDQQPRATFGSNRDANAPRV